MGGFGTLRAVICLPSVEHLSLVESSVRHPLERLRSLGASALRYNSRAPTLDPMPEPKLPLTVVIPTLNEGWQIADALQAPMTLSPLPARRAPESSK
jgi:hypothetical protein